MRLQQFVHEAMNQITLYDISKVLYEHCRDFLLYMKKNNIRHAMYSGRNNSSSYFIKDIRADRKASDTPQDLSDDFDKAFKNQFGWMPRSNAIFVTGDTGVANSFGSHIYLIFPIGKFKFIWSQKIVDLWTHIDNETQLVGLYMNGFAPDGYTLNHAIEEYRYDIEREYERDNPMPDEDSFENSLDHTNAVDDWYNDEQKYIDSAVDSFEKRYIKEIEDENRNTAEDTIYDIVDRYTDKDLKKAIDSDNEIMLNAKKYVAIRDLYDPMIIDFIFFFDWKREPTVDDVKKFAEKFKYSNRNNILWNEKK